MSLNSGGEAIETDEGFVIEVDGEVVGAIQYHEENEPMYRHAGVNIFLTTSRHGEGLGTEAVRVLARHLFQEHGHHRLTIDPAADNAAAIRAYEKAGFRKVGIMRKYERGPDGVWHDGLLMDLLKEPTFRTPLYLVQELTMCHPPSHERYTDTQERDAGAPGVGGGDVRRIRHRRAGR